MGSIRVLTEAELRRAVTIGDEEYDAIEAIYPLISEGVGSMPPIMRIDVPEHNGEIDIKSAYLPGYPGIAVKVSAGFFDNPSLGLPSLGGLMMVLDAETGIPQGALFDNGYLTDLRTALAGAVAAEHLAIPDATVAGVIGAGVQARLQLEALQLVRRIERAQVWARRREQARDYAEEMSEQLGIDIEAVESPDAAARGADVVVTTTPSREPLLDASVLHEGLHITAVGSDAEHKQELAADLVAGADLYVCDKIDQSRRLGELRAALAAGYDEGDAVELGDVIAGRTGGRPSADAVTVCDLTGTGAQDTAIAALAVQRSESLGLGTTLDT
ncbi:MAG: cyclodeaminase [Nitriliruptorales bacterium]|nr:cyclodeaminase [Nitriliruptorales bacterium]